MKPFFEEPLLTSWLFSEHLSSSYYCNLQCFLLTYKKLLTWPEKSNYRVTGSFKLCYKEAQLTLWSSTQKVIGSESSLPKETQAHSSKDDVLAIGCLRQRRKSVVCSLTNRGRSTQCGVVRQSLTREEHGTHCTLAEETNLDCSPSFLPPSLPQFIFILYIVQGSQFLPIPICPNPKVKTLYSDFSQQLLAGNHLVPAPKGMWFSTQNTPPQAGSIH